jgi:hypothetical protein
VLSRLRFCTCRYTLVLFLIQHPGITSLAGPGRPSPLCSKRPGKRLGERAIGYETQQHITHLWSSQHARCQQIWFWIVCFNSTPHFPSLFAPAQSHAPAALHPRSETSDWLASPYHPTRKHRAIHCRHGIHRPIIAPPDAHSR